jgi:hypothetical protein
MPREHVEYVHHSSLPWEPSDVAGLPADTEEKLLSEDPETGASTRLLKITGERRDPVGDPLAWNADVEILVLDGEFWLGSDVLGRFDYAYVPAGATAARFGAPDEATVLFMPDAELSETDPVDGAAVDVKHTADMEWENVAKYASDNWDIVGAGFKILHEDEETGERSWFLASLPQRDGFGVEKHPVAEEAFQLIGALNGDRGTFNEGSYFWRPPDVPHGPYSNDIGSMTFFRVHGGPLETEYVVTADEL